MEVTVSFDNPYHLYTELKESRMGDDDKRSLYQVTYENVSMMKIALNWLESTVYMQRVHMGYIHLITLLSALVMMTNGYLTMVLTLADLLVAYSFFCLQTDGPFECQIKDKVCRHHFTVLEKKEQYCVSLEGYAKSHTVMFSRIGPICGYEHSKYTTFVDVTFFCYIWSK